MPAAAAALQTEKFYDALGSASFITLALGSLLDGKPHHGLHWRQILVSIMVLLWTARLGGFLVIRILHDGSDSRFEQAKKSPMMYLFFWTLQVGAPLVPISYLCLSSIVCYLQAGVSAFFGLAVFALF